MKFKLEITDNKPIEYIGNHEIFNVRDFYLNPQQKFLYNLNDNVFDLSNIFVKDMAGDFFKKIQTSNPCHLIVDKISFGSIEILSEVIAALPEKGVVHIHLKEVSPDCLEKLKKLSVPKQLNLHLNDLPVGSWAILTQVAEIFSHNSNSLILTLNQLSDSSVGELVKTVAGVSSTKISSFQVHIPAIQEKEIEEEIIINILAALSKKVKSVSIKTGNLGNYEEQLKDIFAALHEGVENLKLDYNALREVAPLDLIEAFKCFPKNLKNLSLGHNSLRDPGVVNLTNAFISSSVNLESINLSCNDLEFCSGEELGELFESLGTVKRIILKENGLLSMETSALQTAFAKINETVRELDLSCNVDESEIADHPVAKQFTTLLEELPNSIRMLNLGSNYLGWCRSYELEDIFSHLPENLIWLGLSNNEFHELSGNTLKNAFNCLTKTLESLSLNWNGFHTKTDTELVQCLRGIDTNVREINLGHNGLFTNKSHKQIDKLLTRLKEVNPEGDRLNLSHNGESVIARLIAPMLSAIRQDKMVEEILNMHVFPHLTNVKEPIRAYRFFNQVTKSAPRSTQVASELMNDEMEIEHFSLKRPHEESLELEGSSCKKQKR